MKLYEYLEDKYLELNDNLNLSFEEFVEMFFDENLYFNSSNIHEFMLENCKFYEQVTIGYEIDTVNKKIEILIN